MKLKFKLKSDPGLKLYLRFSLKQNGLITAQKIYILIKEQNVSEKHKIVLLVLFLSLLIPGNSHTFTNSTNSSYFFKLHNLPFESL